MLTNPLRYHHTGTDPIFTDGRTTEIGGHADPEIALVQSKLPDSRSPKGSHDGMYIHREDVASAVVALVVSTGFLSHAPDDEIEAQLQEAAQRFVDVFRESMVPTFRQQFRKALDEAESDWDAKCRMAQIINDYEGLR